jgi:hypothetical protein
MSNQNVEIQRFYSRANRRFWNGRLPSDVTALWDNRILRRDRCVGMLDNIPGVCIVIRISTALQECKALAGIVILHEMAHLAIQLRTRKRYTGHGKIFQKEMLRLAEMGAFAKLW